MLNAPAAPEDPQPRQSSAEAVAFLKAIGSGAPLLFRAIADDPDKKGKHTYQPVELTGTFDANKQRLRQLNDAGFGVFVQVNRADGKGWKAGNIVGCNCLFADFDGIPLSNVERFALAPSITIETSPGKQHFYWRVDGIGIAEFPALQKRLITLFDSDRSIHDLPRIMRLPGFLHQKNPAAPHLVRVLQSSDAAPYTMDAFLTKLGAAEKACGIDPESKRKLPASIAAPGDRKAASDLAIGESALRHSISAGTLDLGDRSEWIRVGIALKASYGEDGFPLFVQLASEADGFEGADDCRHHWDSFKDDLPEGKRLTIATFIANAKYSGWKPPLGAGDGERNGAGTDFISDDDESGGGKGKPDAATTIIMQAVEAGDEHFVSPDGLPYVRYNRKLPDGSDCSVTTRLDGSDYRGVLALRFHLEAVTNTAGKDSINTATGLMEARARAANVVHPVYLRTAHHNGRVYVSLDVERGLAVEIDDTTEGWRVISNPPVRFVAGSRGVLPMPERGGTRETFAKHFNVDDDDLTCTIGFMLGTFQDVEAYPILIANGEHGAAKSNFADKIIALTDPPRGSRKAARFGMSNEERNLHVQAARCSVMFFDNVQVLTAEVGEQLCRISTGGASSFRKHNTMDEEQQMAVCRPIVMTCIAVPAARTDLLSRSLQVTVQSVVHRRTERAVWRDFDADEGKMLGYLFTAVAAALRNRATVDAQVEAGELKAPRMADFAEWVEAAGEAIGVERGRFCEILNDEQAAVQAEAVLGDPFVDGLTSYFRRPDVMAMDEPKLDVTSAELLDLLSKAQPLRDWPNVKTVKARLTKIVQGLRDTGIDVTFYRDGHGKRAKFLIKPNADFEYLAETSPAKEPVNAAAEDEGPEMHF